MHVVGDDEGHGTPWESYSVLVARRRKQVDPLSDSVGKARHWQGDAIADVI